MKIRDRINIQKFPEHYWRGPSERFYEKYWCHYTNSFDLICLECNRSSDCPGDSCEYCKEDWEAWYKNEGRYEEK